MLETEKERDAGTTDSKSSSEPQNQDDPSQQEPPDGGFDAWLQVFGVFLAYVASWGLLTAYGSYQNYYQENLLKEYSPTDIAWIGALQAILLLSGGIISGPIFDRGYVRELLLVGSFLTVFGFMMLSLASKYYQIILSQGVCVGIGTGLIYTPGIALLAKAFTKKRVLAVACATTGAGFGGLLYPIALFKLVPQVGFGWATRVLGFMTLFSLIIANIIILPRCSKFKPQKARSFFDWPALKEPAFLAWNISIFFVFLAYWVPIFFIPVYAESRVHSSDQQGIYLLMITNSVGVLGRIAAALAAPKLGLMNVYFIAVTVTAVVLWGWLGVKTLAGMDVWVIFLGFFSGMIPTLAPAITPSLCPTPDVIGTRLGMVLLSSAIGLLVGVPVATTIANIPNGTFWRSQYLVASAMTTGAILTLFVLFIFRWHEKREGGWGKS